MRKRAPTPEYRVTGSRELGFDTHPAASVQYVVGAFIPPHSGAPEDLPGLNEVRGGLDNPVDLWGALAGELAAFRSLLDEWKKAVRQASRDGRSASSAPLDAAELERLRTGLERESLNLAIVLQEVSTRLNACLDTMDAKPVHVLLGLPAPIGPDEVEGRIAWWQNMLAESGAFDRPQDPEVTALFSRMDILTDEILESLKEINRRARYLWTHEPGVERSKTLLQWTFDLQCECLELAPVAACLRAPMRIWLQDHQELLPEPAGSGGQEADASEPVPDVSPDQTGGPDAETASLPEPEAERVEAEP